MKISKSGSVAHADRGPRSWGILLDLDQTLVLTSRIAHLRDARRWSEAGRSLGETSLPSGTRKFLREGLRMGPLGVVTSSPRSYAERLLEHHAIEVPVLVAYHDVARRKPHPEPSM
jgi:FMN phosphatase YigB (HAD superfamily)